MGVGRRLRQARESRGLSVSEVAASTKIASSQLTLLEAEDYGRLPGGIFALGFVRAAASAVGLDPEELTVQFKEETGTLRRVAPVPAALEEDGVPRIRMAPEPRERTLPRPLIAAIVLVVSAVLLIAWLGRDRQGPQTRGVEPPSPVETARAASDHGEPGAVGTTGTMAHVAGQGPVPIRLEADRPCWVALTVDGKRVAYRMLSAGEAVEGTVRERATLRTGDAGALRLSVNGEPARRVGGTGQVLTIAFTPGDYRTALAP